MDTLKRLNYVIIPRSDNKLSKGYDWIMLVAIIMGIIPLMFRSQHPAFTWFDIISCICFIVDYILRWITAGVRTKGKQWVAYLVYPFTPMAIIDLLYILPTISVIAPAFKLARISRLLKILRVVKIIWYFESLGMILSVIKKQRKILCAVLSVALFYTFITAMIMFNAEKEINPETGEYFFSNFFEAFYWAACTLTTVGYGDIYPISNIGRIISIISSLVGIAIIALPSGIITAGYLEELRSRKENTNGKDSHTPRTDL